ncbi:hypothetical protein D3C81_1754760 [compost metagenome]
MQHLQLGACLGHTAEHRGILLFGIGAHVEVRSQLRTDERHAAEHIAAGKGFAQREVGTQPRHVALRVGVAVAPVELALGAVAQRLCAAQAPAGEIDAAVQVQVLVVAVVAVVVVVVLCRHLVVDESGIDTGIPARFGH